MFTRAYGYKEGTFLYEQDRLRSCGLPKVRIRRATPLSLADTIKWARRIPRYARAAQGFTRIEDFARHVKQLRAKRAELRKPQPDPLRRAILDTLERIMFDCDGLRKAARRQAKANCHPEFPVWWNGKKPGLYDGVRIARGYFPKRNVKVPARWLLARLGGIGNIAVRVHRADPLRRLLATPRWVERVASGDLKCDLRWLTNGQRARVDAIREQRRAEQQRWREAQQRAMAIDPDAPDTLGWRAWSWQSGVLVSPLRRTQWQDGTLKAEQWSDQEALRGEAGIHARRMPKDWVRVDARRFPEIGRCDVHGIVERFGRYVLGTEGWRAEWVVIRELMAPDTKTALALMQRYPEVKVHVQKQEATDEDR
jgi:hypothetical protein